MKSDKILPNVLNFFEKIPLMIYTLPTQDLYDIL